MLVIEYKEASIMNITIKSCEDNVFKWLIKHNNRSKERMEKRIIIFSVVL